MRNYRTIAEIAIYNYAAQQDPDELTVLLGVLASQAPAVVVEIGTAGGGLTWALAQLSTVEAIITVDVAEQRPIPSFGMTVGRQIWRVQGDSGDPVTIGQVADHLAGQGADVLVIDGDHRYAAVERDWLAYTPMVGTGGLVVLHDTQGYPGRPDVEVPLFWAKIRDTLAGVEIVAHPGGPFGTGLIWPDRDLGQALSSPATPAAPAS